MIFFLLYWVVMSLYLVLMLLYSVINSLYSVLIPLYSVLMSFYVLLSSLYSVLISLYSVLPSLYSVLSSLNSVLFSLYSVLPSLYLVLSLLYSVLFSLYSVLPSLYSVLTLFGVFFIITGANTIKLSALFLIFSTKVIVFDTSLFGDYFIIFGAYFISFSAFFDMIVTSLRKGPCNLEVVWGKLERINKDRPHTRTSKMVFYGCLALSKPSSYNFALTSIMVFKRFTFFVRYDRRLFKNCFQQRLFFVSSLLTQIYHKRREQK